MKVRAAYGAVRFFAKAWAAFAFLLLAGAATAEAPRPQLVLALGDSLTAGYQLPPAASFPAQLETALRKAGRQVRVHNAGVSGDTSAGGKARLDWVLKGLKETPDVAIVALGANDMLRGAPVAPMRANLDAIVSELRGRGVEVIVAGMLAAPNLGSAYGQAYNASFPAVARKHGASLYPFFLDGVAANPKYLLADGMHPNAAGVGVMVERIRPTVEAALDRAAARGRVAVK